MSKKLTAEFLGTFWLVFGGCGAAILSTGNPDVGIGWLGVALAFGLTVLTGAYAFGNISGGHFNPAVSLGLMVAGKFDRKELLPYWAAQVLGAIVAGLILWIIAHGKADFSSIGNFALNGYGSASPGGYGLFSVFVTEIVLTAMFLVIILGATSRGVPTGFAPIAIGLGLTLIHLIGIPVSNTSVNPARSTGVALFGGGTAILQLWAFWVGPLLGGALGAMIWKLLVPEAYTAAEAPAVPETDA
jgi:aquaporin Z